VRLAVSQSRPSAGPVASVDACVRQTVARGEPAIDTGSCRPRSARCTPLLQPHNKEGSQLMQRDPRDALPHAHDAVRKGRDGQCQKLRLVGCRSTVDSTCDRRPCEDLPDVLATAIFTTVRREVWAGCCAPARNF